MKIATNNIGNYNPYINNNVKVKRQPVKVEETPKLVPKSQVNNIKGSDQLSKVEKSFFAKLFPGQTEEINNYQFYQRTGEMKSVSIGSIIDRRG